MMKNSLLIATSILCLVSCGQNPKKIQPVKLSSNSTSDNKIMNNSDVIDHVKLAINPKYEDWVLFKNGTYLIFDDVDTIKNVKEEAIKQMKEFGPVFAGGSAGDFNTIHLTKTNGWIVSGHGYGMYTYVNPSEINNKIPNDLEVGLFGRSKRDLDGKNPEIIYINSHKK